MRKFQLASISFTEIMFITTNAASFVNYRKKLAEFLSQYYFVNNNTKMEFLNQFRPRDKKNRKLIISSDGKINLFVLLFIRTPQILILNGFGRYERSYIVRLFFIYAYIFKKKIVICTQSYRDYRYLRRFSKVKLYWVPGSGGVRRSIGSSANPLAICRSNKYKYIERSLKKAISTFGEIDIVGMPGDRIIPKGLNFKGEVEQNHIFNKSSIFIQLDGYGEGVPHSLVDAVCSNMTLIIEKKCWIKMGFYKLSKNNSITAEKDSDFYILKPGSDLHYSIARSVKIEKINKQYLHAIRYLEQTTSKPTNI